MSAQVLTHEIRHAHFFCGLGGGARGFNQGQARVGSVDAKFRCIGGIDVDAGAIRDFERLAGVPGTVLDLFNREQYVAFHGREPSAGWREVTVTDIQAAFNFERPHIVFLSAPCKGFSGLLAEKQSKTDKYQALNGLTVRGVWLMLEAWKDDPPEFVLFENVPRIATRGAFLLNQIEGLLRSYGYAVVGTPHNCGELGNLAQSRDRYLLVGRHMEKVPPFLYEPPKRPLRGVGEVLDRLPLPGDLERGGPMHRVPALQFQTWVRLAFVPAGKDWRALNDLQVENGYLKDFALVPATDWNDGVLGVLPWNRPSGVVAAKAQPTTGRYSVADPRIESTIQGGGHMAVKPWDEPSGTITGDARPSKGPFAVADPRRDLRSTGQGGVNGWKDTAPTVTSARSPLQNRGAVADPRVDGHPKSVQLGVRAWDRPAPTIKGDVSVGTGPYSVADPRMTEGRTPFSNVLRIVPYSEAAPAVTSAAGALAAVADPRMAEEGYTKTKYQVTAYDAASRTVIGASTTGDGAFAVADPKVGREARGGTYGVHRYDEPSGTVAGESLPPNGKFSVADPRPFGTADDQHGKYPIVAYDQPSRAVIGGRDNGAFAVADPRTTHGPNAHQNKHRVVGYDGPAPTVTTSDRVGSGALSVADPRPAGLNKPGRGSSTADTTRYVDHYGVLGWDESAKAVSGSAGIDNGRWSVADRRVDLLPGLKEQVVALIIAQDGTWHRPFTTLELAALQSLFDPEDMLELDGRSDSAWRERIGNAVPSAAARAMADVFGDCLLRAWTGESFSLSNRSIWVRQVQIALSVDVSGQVPAL